MRGNCNFVWSDSDLRLFGQNWSGHHNDFPFRYGKISYQRFQFLPYTPIKCRFLRTHVGVKETVGHCLSRKGHVSRRSEVSAIVTRPAVICRCRASCGDFRVAAKLVCPLRHLRGSLRCGHYIDNPRSLFVLLYVTESVSGAVNDGIGFAGNTEGKVIVWRFLLASPAETRKNKTKGEYEFE